MRARLLLVASLSAAAAACVLGQSPEEEGAKAESAASSVSACMAGARPTTGLALQPALGDKTFASPVGVYPSPTENGTFYVLERKGTVRRVTAAGEVTTFLDLGPRVNAQAGEAGLLGFALHPKFAENGFVYLSFTKPASTSPANQRSVIGRLKSTDGGLTASTSTLVEVLELPDDPYWNHNGGGLAFGPDGNLYAAFGDGGSGGDPLQNGQNKNSLFGKIIRINVDQSSDYAPNYAIPSDNPFRNGGGKPEIFAYGLRNTWRFSFDRLNGDLWAGDVGQNKYEEIDKVVLGGNYGWGKREGKHCFASSGCEIPGAIDPVAEYGRGDGYSVTGGYVYRGTAIPALSGYYLYGDFGSGRIWALKADSPTPTPKLVMESGVNISAFGEDNQGELYVVDYRGKVKKIVGAIAADAIPQKLSQTGCFLESDPRTPTSKLLPYDVNSPLWSDGSDKGRWLALPPNGKIKILPDGDWDLPVGSVLVKEFQVGGKRVETRLFVRHTDGGWAGYTYEWNDAETEAFLLPDGKTKTVGTGGQTWTYPSRAQCMGCHNGAAKGSLGLETAQLNRPFTYADGTTQNQLERLAALGAFDPATPLPAVRPALPSPSSATESAEARARSYLHSNCAFCHRPEGPGRGIADFRFDLTFAQTKVCNGTAEAGDMGVPGSKLLVPGKPQSSLISLRMHTTGAGAMPPIARSVVDTAGTALIDSWIQSVTGCPSPEPSEPPTEPTPTEPTPAEPTPAEPSPAEPTP
jgi:uncharacterized repeat protein (TIGR03806 family)